VGSWSDDVATHGFIRLVNANFITFDVPLAAATVPLAINSKGRVVGYSVDAAGDTHGFTRSVAGNITTIDVQGAFATIPWALNDADQVAGYYWVTSQTQSGFVRDAGGEITTFDAPDSSPYPFGGTLALGINSVGVITG
jgi:hypothetical protein